MSEKEVERVIKKKGKLSRAQMLLCRVRYFSDGAVLGSKEFIDDYFLKKRSQFPESRKSGARKMRYLSEDRLFVLRDLQKSAIGWSIQTKRLFI